MKKILFVLCLGLVVGCGAKNEKVDNDIDELKPILSEIINEYEASIRSQKSYDEDLKQLEELRLELNTADANSVKGIEEEIKSLMKINDARNSEDLKRLEKIDLLEKKLLKFPDGEKLLDDLWVQYPMVDGKITKKH